MQEFAQALGLNGPSATVLDDRLVRSGAAKRRSDGEDRGIVRPLPAIAGTAMAEEYLGPQEAAVTRLLTGLPVSSLVPLAGAMHFLSTIGGGHRTPAIVEGRSPHPVLWRRSDGLEGHFARAGEAIRPKPVAAPWPPPMNALGTTPPRGVGAHFLAGSASLDSLAKGQVAGLRVIVDAAAADVAGLAASLSG